MRRKVLLGIALILVIGLALAGVYVHSRRQLQTLQSQTAYGSPEEGMRELVASWYSRVEEIEIVHAGGELLDDLWFVQAHVWAASRSGRKAFPGPDYDNPACFFLRLEDGWVLVPEGRSPYLVAMGVRVFGQ